MFAEIMSFSNIKPNKRPEYLSNNVSMGSEGGIELRSFMMSGDRIAQAKANLLRASRIRDGRFDPHPKTQTQPHGARRTGCSGHTFA